MPTKIADVSLDLRVEEASVGIIVARGCTTESACAPLQAALDEEIRRARAREGTDDIKRVVRDLLRHGKYKPTGRGKPASEYLLKSAAEDRFPHINNLVDINNLISLRSLLPISLVDLSRAQTGTFAIRRGLPDESYVFNPAGQVIGLQDLLLVSRLPDDVPCANPVKDSMATKLDDTSRDVMAVLYAPPALADVLAQATRDFAEALTQWGGHPAVEHRVLP